MTSPCGHVTRRSSFAMADEDEDEDGEEGEVKMDKPVIPSIAHQLDFRSMSGGAGRTDLGLQRRVQVPADFWARKVCNESRGGR